MSLYEELKFSGKDGAAETQEAVEESIRRIRDAEAEEGE